MVPSVALFPQTLDLDNLLVHPKNVPPTVILARIHMIFPLLVVSSALFVVEAATLSEVRLRFDSTIEVLPACSMRSCASFYWRNPFVLWARIPQEGLLSLGAEYPCFGIILLRRRRYLIDSVSHFLFVEWLWVHCEAESFETWWYTTNQRQTRKKRMTTQHVWKFLSKGEQHWLSMEELFWLLFTARAIKISPRHKRPDACQKRMMKVESVESMESRMSEGNLPKPSFLVNQFYWTTLLYN